MVILWRFKVFFIIDKASALSVPQVLVFLTPYPYKPLAWNNQLFISFAYLIFSCFGFIISDGVTSVYHSGDMKIDQTTYFSKPTNLKRLKQLSDSINFVVADFCGIIHDNNTIIIER